MRRTELKIVRWNRNDWKTFLIGTGTGIISSGFAAFLIFVVKYITNNVQKENVTSQEITINGLGILFMIALGILSILFAFVSKIFLSKLSAIKIAEIRNSIFDKTQDLSPSDFHEYSSNSLMTRLSLDIFNFTMYYNWLIINVIPSIIRWLVFSIMTAIINYLICLIMIGLSVILFLGAMFFARGCAFYYDKSVKNIDSINKIIEENIVGSRVVRSFNLFERQIKRFSKINNAIYENSSKAEIKLFMAFPFAIAFVNAGAVIVVLIASVVNWAGTPFLGQQLDIADILAISSYSYLVLWSVYDSTFLYIFYTRSMVSRKRILEIQKLSNKNRNTSNTLFSMGEIEFKNVSFKYFKNSNDYVLKNISFKIPANTTFGIIGQTGSGKTTLLNLITRMWDVTEGQILVNGIDIRDVNTESLLSNISYAFQEKRMLFSGTIEENIKFSNKEISDDELWEVIEDAQLKEFVISNREGIYYKLEEFGNNLSGGQKQRVNIARALARKASIYLFDDTTSALDNITEKKLLDKLFKKYNKSTLIVTSQKISTIKDMDQILVLNKGQISSIGKHNELLKKDKVYKEIFDLQTRKGER